MSVVRLLIATSAIAVVCGTPLLAQLPKTRGTGTTPATTPATDKTDPAADNTDKTDNKDQIDPETLRDIRQQFIDQVERLTVDLERKLAGRKVAEPPVVKIDDKRLYALHEQFIEGAVKLAGEFEAKKDWENARICYAQILRLVPNYPPAQTKLAAVRDAEAKADKMPPIDIWANRDWQDTGVIVQEGKPIEITASGSWKFKFENELDASGMEIPPELRQFRLGSLVGMIVTDPTAQIGVGNPGAAANTKNANNKNGKNNNAPKNMVFMVGSSAKFTAQQTGRLYLRMYDAESKDNVGKVSVTITGSFEKGRRQ